MLGFISKFEDADTFDIKRNLATYKIHFDPSKAQDFFLLFFRDLDLLEVAVLYIAKLY